MTTDFHRLFDKLPIGKWACWFRPPVMYVCYDSDVCSYYPMDTGIESQGPFPLFSWEYAFAPDGRGGFYVTGGHDENRQVRVQDPYSVGHKPPFPDSFFGPIISEMWHYDVRSNRWTEVEQQCWGPRQCIGARHITYDPDNDCLVRSAGCREAHTPRPPVPLRGWGLFGFWTYDIRSRRWTWKMPFESIGPLTYDTTRHVVLGFKDGRVGAYDVHSNTAFRRPMAGQAPQGEGAFAYDRAHDLCIFHGDNGETWSYDIDANAWTNRRPRPAPPPRRHFAFALDPATGTAILFGGRGKGRGHRDDTWLYDVAENRWRRIACAMKPEGRFWAGPGIIFDSVNRAFVLYGGLAIYKRVKARYATGDVWVFKLPPVERPERRLAAPRVSIRCHADRVELSWPRVRGAGSWRPWRLGGSIQLAAPAWGAGYVVERGTGLPGSVRFRAVSTSPVAHGRFVDRSVKRAVWCHYRVCAVGPGGERGGWSAAVRTDPAVPAAPVVSVLAKNRVEVAWASSPEPDVTGYRVRRVKVVGDDAFTAERIMDVGRRTTFRDRAAGLPKAAYQYQVQAVNRLGVTSGWSAPAGTIPSAPARLIMRPNAARHAITLSWPRNPERGIIGYNLYRWVEPPFRFAFKTEPELITPAWWTFDDRTNPAERMKWVKVNDAPIRGTQFVDRGLRLVNTWYYIRAVNKLGVEGHYRTSYSMSVWRWYTDARRFY